MDRSVTSKRKRKRLTLLSACMVMGALLLMPILRSQEEDQAHLRSKAMALEQQGQSMIYMGIGEPDFTAAPAVIAAATSAMSAGTMQYTAATGLPALREVISAHYASVYDLDIAPSRIGAKPYLDPAARVRHSVRDFH